MEPTNMILKGRKIKLLKVDISHLILIHGPFVNFATSTGGKQVYNNET